ncbi:MAG: helix-turn-helix transcriptional regulator [Gemmatimonadetes bacterium]|nr:helix-turn-helix transcriptional regulator [Gemmatimonadota bacterium]
MRRGLLRVLPRERGTRCCGRETEPQLSDRDASRLSEDLAILAHPVRLQLLDVLSRNEGKVCVCDLEAAVPVKQPTVSHHLRLLREAGLVESERRGLWAYYFLKREALADLRGRITEALQALAEL